jgi:hypothetical protein
LANPPEIQQGWAGRHSTVNLTLPRPSDLTVPVGQGCADPDPSDPWCPGSGGTLYPCATWALGHRIMKPQTNRTPV